VVTKAGAVSSNVTLNRAVLVRAIPKAAHVSGLAATSAKSTVSVIACSGEDRKTAVAAAITEKRTVTPQVNPFLKNGRSLHLAATSLWLAYDAKAKRNQLFIREKTVKFANIRGS
jgi:hypothetical protein